MKKKLLGFMILSILLTSGCTVSEREKEFSRPVSKETAYDVEKADVSAKEKPLEKEKLEIENLKLTDGVISYTVKNNTDSQIYFNTLFIIEEFSSRTDQWENMHLTDSTRNNLINGRKSYDVKLPVAPKEEEAEEQDISGYIRTMGAGTYHTKKFYMNVEKQLMYQLTIQFVKTESGEIESLYAFLKEEPLSGDPLKNLISEPVQTMEMKSCSDESNSDEE